MTRATALMRRYALLGSLGAVYVLIGIANPVFFSLTNLSNILLQASINTTIAVGMTFVIIAGGIDLSVGSIVALSGVVLGTLLHSGFPISGALLISLLVGGACGFLNGFAIAKWRIPPFVATLGMMSAARGGALMLTEGRSVSGFPSAFLWVGTGYIAGIPVPVLVMLALACGAAFLATNTYWGICIYAIGANLKAGLLSGLRVGQSITSVYVLSGVLSSLGAILLTSRLNSALPTAGSFYELDAIAAAVIGGASLSGGKGTVSGTVLGALLIAVLKNGLSILNVSSYLQQILVGGIIIMAVGLEARRAD